MKNKVIYFIYSYIYMGLIISSPSEKVPSSYEK